MKVVNYSQKCFENPILWRTFVCIAAQKMKVFGVAAPSAIDGFIVVKIVATLIQFRLKTIKITYVLFVKQILSLRHSHQFTNVYLHLTSEYKWVKCFCVFSSYNSERVFVFRLYMRKTNLLTKIYRQFYWEKYR